MSNKDQFIISFMKLFGNLMPNIRGKSRALHMIGKLVTTWPSSQRTVLKGKEFEFNLNNGTHRFYYFAQFEQDMLPLVQTMVRPNDIVFDIGANFGFYTIIASELVQQGGHVYAFEPLPPALRQLYRHIELNAIQNVTAENQAVGDTSGVTTIHTFQGQPDTHASLFEVSSAIDESFSCTITTLEQYIEQHPEIDRINLIKVDVEGAELQVFRGGKNLIAKYQPVILFEVNSFALKAAGSSAQEVFSFLENVGYELFRLHGKNLQPIANQSSLSSYNACALIPNKHCHLLEGKSIQLSKNLELP